MTVKENGMTVKELMEFLAKQNPDAIICIGFSCENGLSGGAATKYFELDAYYSKTLKSDVVGIDCDDDPYPEKEESKNVEIKTARHDSPMDVLREKMKQKGI